MPNEDEDEYEDPDGCFEDEDDVNAEVSEFN